MANTKREMTKYGKLLVEAGLASGAGGNISVREGDRVHLSPSGYSLAEVAPSDWITVDLKTGALIGRAKKNRRPTCEIAMHLGCYLSRPEINVVIHTHQVLATALATAGIPFKPVFPDAAGMIGREVPVINYVIPAGKAIRNAVTAQLDHGANVVILKNHGVVAVGTTIKEPYYRCVLLEDAARFMQATLSIRKKIRYMTPKEADAFDCLEAEDFRKMLLKG